MARMPSGGIANIARQVTSYAGSDKPLKFSFQYRGVVFAGWAESDLEKGRMQLLADLGALPYTMESDFRRANALAIVREAGKALGGRVWITPHQHILLMGQEHFDSLPTPRVLIATAVRLVLEAKPFMELLSVVVEPPAARATGDFN